MTLLRKISFLIILLFFSLVLTILASYYKFSILLVLMLIACCYKWHYLLTEEMIVYTLFENKGRMELNEIIGQYGNKAKNAINHLKNKKIIEINEPHLILKVKTYTFSFTKWRPNKGGKR